MQVIRCTVYTWGFGNCYYLIGNGIFPGGSSSKVSAYNAGDQGSIPGSGRSPGGGHVNPLQYSCLENPMDRGALWAIVHGVTKSRTQLSDFTFQGFPGGSGGKECACNTGNLGSIPGSGRSPGGGRVNPLQDSCLENPHGQRSLVD